MQLLIDTDTETLGGLRAAHLVIGAVILARGAEIEGAAPRAPLRPATPPVRETPAIPGPAPTAPPLPVDAPTPPPPVEHPPVHPDAIVPAGTIDPAAVFGNPTVAGMAPPAPPAPSTTPGTALPATTAPAAPFAGAPVAGTSGATAPESASSAAIAERDSRGFPWDERIHSETRKRNADGTWRYRRNLDPNIKSTVDAELMAKYSPQVSLPPQPPAGVAGSVPVPPAPPSVPVPPPAAASMPASPTPPAGGISTAPVAPPAPTATVLPFQPAPPPPVPVPTQAAGVPNTAESFLVPATTFPALVTKANRAIQAGKMTYAQLQEACKAIVGTDQMSALAAQPAKVAEVDQYMARWLNGVAA